jgi:hypothetical protein
MTPERKELLLTLHQAARRHAARSRDANTADAANTYADAAHTLVNAVLALNDPGY